MSLSDDDDDERIKPDSVAGLYQQHAEEIRAFLSGVLKDRDLADEVLQTVFRKTLEKGHTVKESIRSWLFKVAWNEAMLVRRVQTRHASGLQKVARQRKLSDETPEQSVAAAVRGETIERVRKAIDALPEEQRVVLRLRIYEDRKFATIADELGIPLGTVLTRMRSAVLKLESSLGKHFNE